MPASPPLPVQIGLSTDLAVSLQTDVDRNSITLSVDHAVLTLSVDNSVATSVTAGVI